MSKKGPRRKRVPQRTCVGCRAVRPKRELVRIVRTPEESVAVDETGKRSGRGAYLCPKRDCWEKALAKGRVSRALRVSISPETRVRLQEYAADFQPEIGASAKGVGEDE